MSKSLPKLVGETLRAARRAAGLTAAELIEKTGEPTITRSLVSRYETGAVLPGHDRLTELLRACGAEVPAEITDGYRDVAQSPTMGQVRPAEDVREFIRVWQGSADIAEVMRRTGLTRKAVYARAMRLRSHKVPLKKMTRSGEDWEALRKLAEDLLGDQR